MIVLYDSRTDKLTYRGRRTSTTRIWTIQVRADKVPEVITVKTNQPVPITAISGLVEEELRSYGVKPAWVRWTATAR